MAFHNLWELYMTSTTSRRAILAGIAAIPAATSLPAIATAATEPDPIFAAIERHKVAFPISMAASSVRMGTVDAKWSSEYDPVKLEKAEAARSAADDEAGDAAFNLTLIEPTTFAGIVALIDYMEEFNQGQFRLEGEEDEWFSAAYMWPAADQFEFEGHDERHDPDGELGMAYAILLNVRDALRALAVQS